MIMSPDTSPIVAEAVEFESSMLSAFSLVGLCFYVLGLIVLGSGFLGFVWGSLCSSFDCCEKAGK